MKKSLPPAPSPKRRGGAGPGFLPLSALGRGWGEGFFHRRWAGGRPCDELREDVQLENERLSALPAPSCPPAPPGDPPRLILLTGATGFLGSRLLDELLSRTGA